MELIWLIDMGYVTKASKGRGKVDYIATKGFLETFFKLPCQPLIFNSVDAFGVDYGLNQFYYTVKKAGFTVNLYKMEGGAQKQVDVAIASYLIHHIMSGNSIVLSSGDVDFVPALQLAHTSNPEATLGLLTFNFGVHQDLSALATPHLYFEDHPEMMRN